MTKTSAAKPADSGFRIGHKLEQGSAADFRRCSAIDRLIEANGAASTRPAGAAGRAEMSDKLTLEDAMRLMRDAMESAANEALTAFGERPTVVRDGNRLYMQWADGSITNEVEAEYVQ